MAPPSAVWILSPACLASSADGLKPLYSKWRSPSTFGFLISNLIYLYYAIVRILWTLCIFLVDFALAKARPWLSQSSPLLLNILQQTNSEKRRVTPHCYTSCQFVKGDTGAHPVITSPDFEMSQILKYETQLFRERAENVFISSRTPIAAPDGVRPHCTVAAPSAAAVDIWSWCLCSAADVVFCVQLGVWGLKSDSVLQLCHLCR